MAKQKTLSELYWPLSKLGDALAALGRHVGLPLTINSPILPPDGLANEGELQLKRWVEAVAQFLGVEAQPIRAPYREIDELLAHGGPALLQVSNQETEGKEPQFLALLPSKKKILSLLGPDLEVYRFSLEEVRGSICEKIESYILKNIDGLFTKTGLDANAHQKIRKRLLKEYASKMFTGNIWLLRLPPESSFIRQISQAKLWRYVVLLLICHISQYALFLASWWLIGTGVLDGTLELGWLIAWALILLTLLPFRILNAWAQGRLSLGMGSLLKQRLLQGSLRLDPEEIRHQGAGQLLGYVTEADAIESLALSGGVYGILAFIELGLAGWVLYQGAGGVFHLLLLFGWTSLIFMYGWRYYQHRRYWTDARISMTNTVVERMVGHRTRLVQNSPSRWHDGEDQTMEAYVNLSRALDQSTLFGNAFLVRGWVVAAILVLALSFLLGQVESVGILISLGGILFSSTALSRLIGSISAAVGAVIAWNKISPLFRAANRTEIVGSPAFAISKTKEQKKTSVRDVIIDARELVFRYRERGEPILRGVNFQISSGDRILLEGPSGGGKSTLASLLIGLRNPETGLLLLDGLDQQTLGVNGWRRRVVSAPQFHENHVFTETFAFNLLMGRQWPPEPKDLQEAEEICYDLGLGPLLEKMPSGLQQMVGESGWQLSHGEKSRLYLARALLQKADLIVLDESFAALDPDTLGKALQIVIEKAPTLLIIAHP